MKHHLHIGIIGCGAIGIGLAHLLTSNRQHASATSKLSCTLLIRADDQKDGESQTTEPKTVSIIEAEQQHAVDADILPLKAASEALFSHLDLLIIPVKYYHLPELIAQLKPLVPDSLDLLLVQNGLGGGALLQEAFKQNTLYLGSTTDAITTLPASQVKVHARGELVIGAALNKNKLPPYAVQTLAVHTLIAAHPQGRWDSNIMRYLYQKLAVNAVINPLTVKFSCRNGDIRQHPEWISGIKNEIVTLYKLMDLEALLLINFEDLNEYIDEVIDLTANNYSSMYQDVANNRQTEVDSILGTLIKKAAEHKLRVPLIQSLYDEIVSLNKD